MNGNEICVIALHYATHVNKKEKKKKQKKKRHFHPLLNPRLTPIILSGHKSGKMHKSEGPLVYPNKVTVHSATVNSKNVASAKVNIFYSDIPSAWWSTMVSSYRRTSGTRALLGGQPHPVERGFSSGSSECLICSSWSRGSSGCA